MGEPFKNFFGRAIFLSERVFMPLRPSCGGCATYVLSGCLQEFTPDLVFHAAILVTLIYGLFVVQRRASEARCPDEQAWTSSVRAQWLSSSIAAGA